MKAAFALEPQPAGSRLINLLVLHCSATPSGRWLRGAAGTTGYVPAAKVIDGWHQARGFERSSPLARTHSPDLQHIGYHYVVELDGTIQAGRSLSEVGAHVQGMNANSVGICMVGGAELDAKYTAQQWRSVRVLVMLLCKQLGLTPWVPLYPRNGGGVCGHRDLSPDANKDGRITSIDWLKTCPGFDVGAWLGRGLEPTLDQICEVTQP